MRQFILVVSLVTGLLSGSSIMALDCGQVDIINMLAGPRHGSMMQVSNAACGSGGWVCLDPAAQYMPAEESRRLHEFVLEQYMADRSVRLNVFDGVYAIACGSGYPVVEDIRSQ